VSTIFHLVHVNIAVAKYDYEDPRFAGFVDNLDLINDVADHSPGFVWRYVTEDDDAEAKRVFENDALLFNMSVWESVDSLRRFAYESDHLGILRQRGDWFIPQDNPIVALWWQPAGQIPGIVDAKHRLDCLAKLGPTADAFTFRSAFEAPAST
jgi:hypothetical protein